MSYKSLLQRLLPLKSTKSPNLLVAPVEYSQLYQDQLINALRLYFASIDNFTQAVSTYSGGVNINFPYGAFSSTQTQSPTTINTPKLITFNSTDFNNSIQLTDSNSFTVEYAGIYNVAFSVQVTNGDTQSHDVDIYFRKNGMPIPNTANVFSVQGTHGGQPGYNITAANFFIQLLATDTLDMYWSSNSTQVQLNYLPAITSPFISPGAPSVVLTFTFVSAT